MNKNYAELNHPENMMSKPSKEDIQHMHHTPHAPYKDVRTDPYAYKGKPSEPATCSICHVVFHDGHWSWKEVPPHAANVICPACRRIKDDLPAGYLELKGTFLKGHKEEMLNLICHKAEYERSERPLQRIIKIKQQDDGVMITTTDVHLARGLGEAIKNAYQGELQLNYSDAEYVLRVTWCRYC